MSDGQEIVQSRFGYTNRFRFGEDQLKVTSRNRSGESTRSLNYEIINLDDSSTLKVKAGRRYGLLIALIGTALTMTIQYFCPGRLDFAVVAACVTVVAYFGLLNVITLTFTLLQLAGGAGEPIRIIHDKRHDEILQRIKSGWIARQRKLHLAVNSENAPKQEGRKFKWLLDQGVISDAEYQAVIAQLSARPSGLPDDAGTAAVRPPRGLPQPGLPRAHSQDFDQPSTQSISA
jgi:hypothetical protein